MAIALVLSYLLFPYVLDQIYLSYAKSVEDALFHDDGERAQSSYEVQCWIEDHLYLQTSSEPRFYRELRGIKISQLNGDQAQKIQHLKEAVDNLKKTIAVNPDLSNDLVTELFRQCLPTHHYRGVQSSSGSPFDEFLHESLNLTSSERITEYFRAVLNPNQLELKRNLKRALKLGTLPSQHSVYWKHQALMIMKELGQRERALKFVHSIVKKHKAHNYLSKEDFLTFLLIQGEVKNDLGDLKGARNSLEAAEGLLTSSHYPRESHAHYHSIHGYFSAGMGDYANSIRSYQTALEYYSTSSRYYQEQFQLITQITNTLYLSGETSQALTFIDNVINTHHLDARLSNNNRHQLLITLSQISLSQGNSSHAQTYLKSTLPDDVSLSTQMARRLLEVETLFENEKYQQVTELHSANDELTQIMENHSSIITSAYYSLLIRSFLLLKKNQKAISLYEKWNRKILQVEGSFHSSTSQRERSNWFECFYERTALSLQLSTAKGIETALHEKLIFLNQSHLELSESRENTPELVTRLEDLRKVLRKKAKNKQLKGSLGTSNLEKLEQEVTQLELKIAQRNGKSALLKWRLSPSPLKSTNDQTITLEYLKHYDYDDRLSRLVKVYSVVVFRKKHPPVMVRLGAANKIETLVRQLQTTLSVNRLPSEKAVLQKGYQTLISPIQPLIDDSKKALLFAPAGELSLIPYEELRDSNNVALGTLYEIIRTPTSGNVVSAKSQTLQQGGPTVVFLSNSKEKSKLKSSEEKRIQEFIQDSPKHWTSARFNSYSKLLASKIKPKILHIAAHGTVLPASENSSHILRDPRVRAGVYLENADGEQFINGHDFSRLDLSTCELVVISSCDSGKGEHLKGRGFEGLVQSFFDAGTQNVIVSLAPVPHEETSLIMEKFYKAYLEGVPPAEALNKAKAMRREKEASLRTYAPFVIYQTPVRQN